MIFRPSFRGIWAGGDNGAINAVLFGNSYTGTDPTYNYGAISAWLNAMATEAAQSNVAADTYWVGGYDFGDHVADALSIAKAEAEVWSHASLQDISAGTINNLAGHISDGLLLAERQWDSSPNCKVILFQTPAYAADSPLYPSVAADPEAMYAAVSAGYQDCLDNIQAEHPDKNSSILALGQLVRALGGGLVSSNPSFQSFHAGDKTHANENRRVLEACAFYTKITGRDATPIIAAVCTTMAVTPGISATTLATRAYRFVKYGVHPVLFTTHPQSQTVSNGDPVTFTTAVISSGGVTYQWRRDGVFIPGETSSSLTLASVAEGDDDGAVFQCVATDGEGDVYSDGATLTVLVDIATLNPVQWYEARLTGSALDDGAAQASDGEAVSTFVDLGSAASNATGALTTRPLFDADGDNGNGCLVFDGVDDILLHTYSRGAGQTGTVYIRVKASAGQADYRRLYCSLGNGSANEWSFIARGTGMEQWGGFGGVNQPANTNIQTGQWVNLCAVRTGAGGNFFLNNVADGTFANMTGGAAGRIGGQAGQFFAGPIATILVFHDQHDEATRAAVDAYLNRA